MALFLSTSCTPHNASASTWHTSPDKMGTFTIHPFVKVRPTFSRAVCSSPRRMPSNTSRTVIPARCYRLTLLQHHHSQSCLSCCSIRSDSARHLCYCKGPACQGAYAYLEDWQVCVECTCMFLDSNAVTWQKSEYVAKVPLLAETGIDFFHPYCHGRTSRT